MQIVLTKRAPIHGVSFTLNYTWDKAMDDVQNFLESLMSLCEQSGPRVLLTFQTTLQPMRFMIFPLAVVTSSEVTTCSWSSIVGGWRVTGVFEYASGYAIAVTTGGCNTGGTGGTCIPDLTPGYTGSPRIHGGYGSHVTAATLGTTQYLDPTAFTTPPSYSFGNAPATAPYHLYGPGDHNLDMSVVLRVSNSARG